MTFTIRYNKTGKEITLSNAAIWLHLYAHWLDKLGFVVTDVWER